MDQIDSAEAALLNGIGGGLSNTTTGHNRPCGQTMGEDGTGEFCVMFYCAPEESHEACREYLRKLQSNGYTIREG